MQPLLYTALLLLALVHTYPASRLVPRLLRVSRIVDPRCLLFPVDADRSISLRLTPSFSNIAVPPVRTATSSTACRVLLVLASVPNAAPSLAVL